MTTTTSRPDELAWASIDACTLPTAERPLRLAEFDDLFAHSLHGIERADDTRARLLLRGDEQLAERVQRLADAEARCCSFFTFGVSTLRTGATGGADVFLDIEVPAARLNVLDGLIARARAAHGEAS